MSNNNPLKDISQFLFNYSRKLNDDELNRYRYIDTKGNIYITLITILLGILSFLLSRIIKDIFPQLCIEKTLDFFFIFLIFFNIYIFIRAFYQFFYVFKSYELTHLPFYKEFIDECLSGDYELNDIYCNLIEDNLTIYERNMILIEEKSNSLNELRVLTSIFFVSVILLTTVFFIYIYF